MWNFIFAWQGSDVTAIHVGSSNGETSENRKRAQTRRIKINPRRPKYTPSQGDTSAAVGVGVARKSSHPDKGVKLYPLDLHGGASELPRQVFGRRPLGERCPDRRRFVGGLDLMDGWMDVRCMMSTEILRPESMQAANKGLKKGKSDGQRGASRIACCDHPAVRAVRSACA